MNKKLKLMVNSVSKRYGGVQALKDVTLHLDDGEIVCLAGENGCGKSTLSKIIAGAEAQDSGSVFFNNVDISNFSIQERMALGIHIIYQDFSLFPNLSVAENIYLVKQSSSKKTLVEYGKGIALAAESLKSIGVDLKLEALVSDLTVAEKQSVAIARTIIQNANLIIMDEPTTALTDDEINKLLLLVKHLKSQGISFIFISHKLEEVLDISDRVFVMRNGMSVLDQSASKLNISKITCAMIGCDLPSPPVRRKIVKKTNASLLKVDNINRSNKFSNISFSLQKGEVLGLSGKMGSGRTDLALSLFGMLPLDSGRIYINNQLVDISSVRDALFHGIAYVPEDRLTEGLFLTESINLNIATVKLDSLLTRFGTIDESKLVQQGTEWISKLSIATPSGALPVNALSGGNQQKVLLSKWLSSKPKIIILNRPTVGVDVGSKSEIHHTICKVADLGIGVIIISDDISELKTTCNTIIKLDKGCIVNQSIDTNINVESIEELEYA
ncbi:sugar ABC transporter ATP-binding protein [Photobacterium sp. DNB23_23_1]